MKSASEEFRDKLWLDFSVFSYRLTHRTATIFAGITLIVPMVVVCVLTIALGGGMAYGYWQPFPWLWHPGGG